MGVEAKIATGNSNQVSSISLFPPFIVLSYPVIVLMINSSDSQIEFLSLVEYIF